MIKQVRKINPTRRSVSGHYPFRGNESLPYESSLERDFIMLQEFNASVVRVVPQPVEIPFNLGTRKYKYTPDFLVLLNSNSCKGILVEVKPEIEWRKHWRKWLSKWKAAYRWAKEHDFIFHIYDENRIRGQVLQNIKMISSFKRGNLVPAHADAAVIRQFFSQNPRRISDYLYLLPNHEKSNQYRLILTMLANNILSADFNKPITSDSFIWVTENG
ncbi:transposase [Neisseria zoodegmatis]|uniref:Transposase n=1 Tax=Neisseria zoodegmatis TaxID=326523 RepID=A0A378X6V2_9NEIS|nr:TnsA endonuclease N-terminal domain-containing protein [Neisseria zoodegmatis]SUA48872.1 transposase [Neisseria zoodegmatis]